MADSTTPLDISKMKVVDLRKELKARGLPHKGDKAELVSTLQAAIAQEEHADINLDSDEIDSDGVLEDETHGDLTLDDTAVELALSDQPPTKEEAKPVKAQKRKAAPENTIASENKDTKKIVLNRRTSSTTQEKPVATEPEPPKNGEEKKPEEESNKVKITAEIDPKSRLELRAKRFGLPVNMSDEQRKEARKMRFGGGSDSLSSLSTFSSLPGTAAENLEKLKKRAERFGQSVSRVMSDIEAKEKLERRKLKFGTVN